MNDVKNLLETKKFSRKKLLALLSVVILTAIGVGGYAYYANSNNATPPSLEMDLTSLAQGKLSTIKGFAELPGSYGYACNGSEISLSKNVNHVFAKESVTMKQIANSLKFDGSRGQYLIAFFSPGDETAVNNSKDTQGWYLYPTNTAPFNSKHYDINVIADDNFKIPAYRGFQIIVNNSETKMCGSNFQLSNNTTDVWKTMTKAEFTDDVKSFPKGWVMVPMLFNEDTFNAVATVFGTSPTSVYVQNADNNFVRYDEFESTGYSMVWLNLGSVVNFNDSAWDKFNSILNPEEEEPPVVVEPPVEEEVTITVEGDTNPAILAKSVFVGDEDTILFRLDVTTDSSDSVTITGLNLTYTGDKNGFNNSNIGYNIYYLKPKSQKAQTAEDDSDIARAIINALSDDRLKGRATDFRAEGTGFTEFGDINFDKPQNLSRDKKLVIYFMTDFVAETTGTLSVNKLITADDTVKVAGIPFNVDVNVIKDTEAPKIESVNYSFDASTDKIDVVLKFNEAVEVPDGEEEVAVTFDDKYVDLKPILSRYSAFIQSFEFSLEPSLEEGDHIITVYAMSDLHGNKVSTPENYTMNYKDVVPPKFGECGFMTSGKPLDVQAILCDTNEYVSYDGAVMFDGEIVNSDNVTFIQKNNNGVSYFQIVIPTPSSAGDYELIISGVKDMAGNELTNGGKYMVSYTPTVVDNEQPYIDDVTYEGDGIYTLYFNEAVKNVTTFKLYYADTSAQVDTTSRQLTKLGKSLAYRFSIKSANLPFGDYYGVLDNYSNIVDLNYNVIRDDRFNFNVTADATTILDPVTEPIDTDLPRYTDSPNYMDNPLLKYEP